MKGMGGGMMDMGMTQDEKYGPATIGKSDKNEKFYDSITMMSDKMPKDMGEMHAGETHSMMAEMMVKSVESTSDGKKKYKLELRKLGKASKKEKEINPYKKSANAGKEMEM